MQSGFRINPMLKQRDRAAKGFRFSVRRSSVSPQQGAKPDDTRHRHHRHFRTVRPALAEPRPGRQGRLRGRLRHRLHGYQEFSRRRSSDRPQPRCPARHLCLARRRKGKTAALELRPDEEERLPGLVSAAAGRCLLQGGHRHGARPRASQCRRRLRRSSARGRRRFRAKQHCPAGARRPPDTTRRWNRSAQL